MVGFDARTIGAGWPSLGPAKPCQLLRAAVGFAGCSLPSYDRSLWTLRTWLASWPGLGRVAVGMARQGYDLQLTRYDEKGWRATFYTTAHQCDRHRVGAHAVARDAAGGVHARFHRRRRSAFRDRTGFPRGARLRRRRHPSRQLKESLGQRRQVALHLLDRQDVGVLGLHVAEVDGVTGLGAVEARLLGDGDAKVVAEGVEHRGA